MSVSFPSLIHNRSVRFVAGTCAVLVLLQQFGTLPGRDLLSRAVQNAAHTPLFFILTLLMWRLHPLLPATMSQRRKLLYIAAGSIALGALTEIAQIATRRDASLTDWARDVVGTLAALATLRAWQSLTQRQWSQVAVWCGAALISGLAGFAGVGEAIYRRHLAASSMPDILPMSSVYMAPARRRGGSWEFGTVGELRQRHGRPLGTEETAPALAFEFADVQYPGLNIPEPYADWRGYQWLVITAEVLNRPQLLLMLRAETQFDNGQRFLQYLPVGPAPTTLRVPLARLLPLNATEAVRVESLLLFAEQKDAGSVLLLHGMHLE